MRFASTLLFLLIFSLSATADIEADKTAGARALADSDYEKAAEILYAVIEEDPDDGQVRYSLAMALMSLDRLDEAATQFEAAGEAGFQPLGVGYRLARIQARQGDKEAALASLD
ncbi:MAG: tetratricopeptide repeat protein, partial [Gammaproteobacteria bacterium]